MPSSLQPKYKNNKSAGRTVIDSSHGGSPVSSSLFESKNSLPKLRNEKSNNNDNQLECVTSLSPENNLKLTTHLSFEFDKPSKEKIASSASQLEFSADSFQNNKQSQETSGILTNNSMTNGKLGNMLERIHNVTSREILPQKRRKIMHEQNDILVNHINKIDPGSGGSLLDVSTKEGERSKSDEMITTSGTKPLHISLVDDNDENNHTAQAISDSEMREVCYGRIEGAEIMAFKVPTPKPGAFTISSGFWPQVHINLRRLSGERVNVIHAVDATRSAIGTIDVNTAIGLTPLIDSRFGFRTTSRVLTRAKKENDLPPGSDISTRYALDLNLYGPKKHALSIGKHLSQRKIWLRTPLFVEAGVELYNPHAIRPPPSIPSRNVISNIPTTYRQQRPVRTTEEIRNDVIGMFDSLKRSENLPEMNPNHLITTELLKHQKQGLYFMAHKEKLTSDDDGHVNNVSLWKEVCSAGREKVYVNVITGQEEHEAPPQLFGGILADMMGLGKTLLSLSLIAYTLDKEAQEWAKLEPPIFSKNSKKNFTYVRKGKTVVSMIEPTPLLLNAKTTLLVSPLSTIANWEDQIKQHLKPNSLSYYIYHGANRLRDPVKLAEYDLVITTYGSVASEFNHRVKEKGGSYPLEEINWFRIMLDEAHMIREQSTQQFKAICRLAANRRWAITGTPVQNRLDDLGALIIFLRIKPFDEKGSFAQYIMTPFKMCDPEILPKLRLLVDSITLRRLKDRIDLPPRHDRLVKLDFSDEERMVYDVFAKNASDRIKVIVGQRENNSLSGKSYVHILQAILRLRLICAHGKDLLSKNDLKVMNGLSKDSAIDLDSDREDDSSLLTKNQAYEMYNLMKETYADICLVCSGRIAPSDTAVDPDGDTTKDEIFGYMTPCYHLICCCCFHKYKCDLEEYAQGQSKINCPICQQHIKISYTPLSQACLDDEKQSCVSNNESMQRSAKDITAYSGPHTKTKALLEDLNLSRQKSEQSPSEPPIKSVVFSGWTAHLDLIQLALEENGINYVRLDGKMSRAARRAAMDTFRDDLTVLVILVSITAGGLGLNLTVANQVYVMEPQYNPASEAQAIDRVHRLGQKRIVETKRYIMRDSFEEKMLMLQEKKIKLANLSMDGEGVKGRIDKAEAARKRLEDLRSLFK